MIAFILNTILYGVGMLLVGQYFQSHSSHDTASTKSVVAILGFLSTIQVAFLSHQVYIDYVNLFGERSDLDRILFSAPVQLMAIFLVAFVAQMFFASRIWIITKRSLWYTVPVVILSFLQLGAGVAQVLRVFELGQYSKLHYTAAVSSTQSGATAACDVVITAVLCWVLHDARSSVRKSFVGRNFQLWPRGKAFKTEMTINRLITYAIERGAATSACALLNLAFFVGTPHTFIFMVFLEPSCPLYLISVVSMLANRTALRAELAGDEACFTDTMDPRQLGDRYILSAAASRRPSIHVLDNHSPQSRVDGTLLEGRVHDGVDHGILQKQVVTW
ncbi:hypothetical protein GALMADRAFT_821529 [Galerina marginata CBS 339.88]|uniref:DUF6534 domain-containing protein n=1 Tax=Galerina marginata (strain CBS 339.88) TaxID=685588 RepID=A0A067TGY6_GALM3|nr:hypothetical protein GALMADRAFT_821529 [Galerina marginata CBS 339.88]